MKRKRTVESDQIKFDQEWLIVQEGMIVQVLIIIQGLIIQEVCTKQEVWLTFRSITYKCM
jgi:hypothetical protein